MSKKKTALYDSHVELQATLVNFHNTLLPLRYQSERQEHLAVRKHVGIFDVSHMGEIKIIGKHASSFLNYLLSNNVENLDDGCAQYTLMLNDEGGIIDDLIIYKLAPTSFLICANAANIEKDFNWLSAHKENFEVDITNASGDVSQIAIQGPNSEALIKNFIKIPLPKKFCFKQLKLDNEPVIIARTGFTGEDGFEIFLANNSAKKIFKKLLEKGRQYGAMPAGLAARDSLRLEAGMLLCGTDMDESKTPMHARLMFAVDLNKEDFIGKKALIKQKNKGVEKRLIGFCMLEKGIPRNGYEIFDEQNQYIGVVTSGSFPPGHEMPFGIGYVKTELAKKGKKIKIKIRNRMLNALTCSMRFVKK